MTAFAEESVETPEISVESVTSEEVVEETESVENSSVLEAESDDKDETTEITYDDILALAGKLAEKEGFKDEWDKTLYYIETAASEKKVDAMIVLLVAVFAFLL